MRDRINSTPLYTRHAHIRASQRGIPPLLVEWLLDFGSCRPADGAEVFYFDKESRERLRKYAGRQALSKLDRLLNIYAVVIEPDRYPRAPYEKNPQPLSATALPDLCNHSSCLKGR